MPYPKNKYRKGYTIFSVADLADEVVLGHWLFYKGRVIHPSFIGHMNLFTIIGGIRATKFHHAINQQKEYYGDKVKPYANL